MKDRPAELMAALRKEALNLGFSAMGVTTPHSISSAGERLRAWIDDAAHGEMQYMADRMHWRSDPAALWPEARSIIMLAESYAPPTDALAGLKFSDRGNISVYARGGDYHDTVKKRLKRLGTWLLTHCRKSENDAIKVFVDTAPVMEKPLAQAAGLGWIGKHANLLSRTLGNWFFLGAIFTTIPLPTDAEATRHCGACRKCLDVCPTAAFNAPFQLDARRCISYLTIELKGPIPRAFRPLLGNRIYGCDDCLAVCPWNKFAQAAHAAAYFARVELQRPRLDHLARLSEAAFREVFAGSPIKRIGRDRFIRNVLIAIGNSNDSALADTAESLLTDPSPLVRGVAIWALGRLAPKTLAQYASIARREADETVIEEWRAEMVL